MPSCRVACAARRRRKICLAVRGRGSVGEDGITWVERGGGVVGGSSTSPQLGLCVLYQRPTGNR